MCAGTSDRTSAAASASASSISVLSLACGGDEEIPLEFAPTAQCSTGEVSAPVITPERRELRVSTPATGGLRGRTSECALMHDLVAAVRRGQTRSRGLNGERGRGKTA